MSLRINSTSHVLHAFVNGQHIGNYRVENRKFHYVFEQDAKFNPGVNVITLLSVTVGLPNYGAFFENVLAGITGPVFIIGGNGDETVVKVYHSTELWLGTRLLSKLLWEVNHLWSILWDLEKERFGSMEITLAVTGQYNKKLFLNWKHINSQTLKSLKLRSAHTPSVQSPIQTLCGILNLHGRGLHVREDPPVLLRFSTHLLHNRVLTSSPYRYVMSELISQYATNLAIIPKHLSNITLARTRVQALSRVVLFGPVRFMTLTTFTTPLGLLTMAICSSIDSSLEELSIIFDLTCTKMLYSFWLKALKELLSIKPIDHFIYLFIYLMLALWNAPYGYIVNFGISDSLLLCTWFLS
ncbi:unnamed protein product [Arabidopsis thaliana]|uniref:(thale cress) hypothetical protein n=1 Tax=Arabidopsis thaliana TaxID=3702 RepID=A0A7G2E7D7_ARATH|nr:unnamed protein product [Arabidopsis thaliana]